MGIFDKKQRRRDGFTIVELIIIIAVIGILAAITMMTFPNYQKQSRDNERKSDLGQLSAALGTYAFQTNTTMGTGSGCGLNGNGNGWVSAGPSNIAAYPKSVVTCLQDIQALPTGVFTDPSTCVYDSGGDCGSSGGTPVRAYMKATCTKGGNAVTYLFAHLETQPRKDSEVNALCDAGSVSGYDASSQLWGTLYGMNYYVAVR